ncbi:MAG: 4Fe-4S dicluster domain-containing protein [Clostridia bacterium]
MITIDSSKCVRCGDCKSICHASAISHGSESIEINYKLCSTCCQCIACCPTGALSWNGIKSRKIIRELLPEDESLIELLKARHSIRSFKDKHVERGKLEKICVTAKLAPTNNYDIELIVVQDIETIAKLPVCHVQYDADCSNNRFGLLRIRGGGNDINQEQKSRGIIRYVKRKENSGSAVHGIFCGKFYENSRRQSAKDKMDIE